MSVASENSLRVSTTNGADLARISAVTPRDFELKAFWHHLVDHAYLVSTFGGDILAKQHELHCDLVWDAGNGAGDQSAGEAELGFRVFEDGIVRGND